MLGWLKRKRGPVLRTARFRRAPSVAAAAEGGRTVLLDPERGEYFGLDEVGTRIWELLPDHPSAVALAERLVEEYDAPAGTLEADAAALLGQLADAGLVLPA
jgi:hypothetical protein